MFSQGIKIEHLSDVINSYGSEFNFVQTDEGTAYFTSSTLEDEKYQSVIFSTIFKDGSWQKGSYINLGKSYSSANVHFPKNEPSFYFSICDQEENCKIAFRDYKKQITENLNDNINLINSTNTQPHIVFHNKQKVMYFVSDRKGGHGGMDIWLSIIDKNGNFGIPINAGLKINSKFDEITPFFNEPEGELYFSSNRKNGLGGFDIYKSKGRLNLWEKPINVIQLNSKQDEMYLTFYNEIKGYFASNRSEAIYNTKEFCCNDIFSFELQKQEIEEKINIHSVVSFIPLSLYFHNDEPDCCSMNTSTDKTYKEAYASYFKMEDEYNKYNPNLKSFFEHSLKGNFNKLNIIFSHILSDLKQGKKIELQIKGYASPLHKKQYNINLSKRRIKSFVNYIELHQGKVFSSYLENGNFQIIELPFGENNAANSVSANPNDKKNSIYGIDAMLERKIEIIDIKLIE
jgi:hypothetical protein